MDKSRYGNAEDIGIPSSALHGTHEESNTVFPMTNAYTPEDVIEDFLRHPTSVVLDMRRYPEDFKMAKRL
uniref:Uncharacterized protein n=1 Tax=Fervidicoccus fontis TaxID=683846 RepID=A0A7J3ZK58_9CREN